jgi:hypothetical protein
MHTAWLRRICFLLLLLLSCCIPIYSQDSLSPILPSPWSNRLGGQLLFFFEDGDVQNRGQWRSFLTVVNLHLYYHVTAKFQLYNADCKELFSFVDTLRSNVRINIDPQAVRGPEGTALNLLIAAVIGSMLGSKLLYLLQYGPGMLFTSGALLEIRSGGYSLYGGLIGGCLPPFIYLHWKRLNTGAFANACAPAMALGLALTRTGCFLKGCNFGTPTDLPWGVSFPPDSHLAAHHFN